MQRRIEEQLEQSMVRLLGLIEERERIIKQADGDCGTDATLLSLFHRLRLVEENKRVVEKYLRPLTRSADE